MNVALTLTRSRVLVKSCSLDARAILSAAGYLIRGRRADCPYCEGHARLTVSFTDSLYFCHRCKVGGSIRRLAQASGVPPPRLRKADVPKRAFEQWLHRQMNERRDEEYIAWQCAKLAIEVLKYLPECELAWNLLAAFYHREHEFEEWWVRACDKIGRYWMYRDWRKNVYPNTRN